MQRFAGLNSIEGWNLTLQLSLFIAMPSKKAVDGEYRDIAHPINSETREKIQSIILENYEKVLEEAPEEAVI